jgi:fluoride exporter
MRLIWIGLGGFAGTLARYLLGGLIVRWKGSATFPYETLVVNVLGCLVIGLLAALAEERGLFAGTTRTVLFIGVLGGFTTFSSFAYETVQLARDGQFLPAAASVTLQLTLGLAAVWAGGVAGRLLGGAS